MLFQVMAQEHGLTPQDAESTHQSLSQKDVRWQAYSDAKYYADDGVRDSCQWPQLTRHDKVPDRQVEG